MFPLVLTLTAFVPMLAEAWRSATNERRLRRAGAVEPAGDVFAAMQAIYPICFAAMIAEAWSFGRGFGATANWGLVVFCGAKALKYWAVASLGVRWTFRVLVPPGSERTLTGPYRYLRHPNYVAVVGELAGFALFAQAFWTGVASLVVFGLLLIARIRVEERALGLASGSATQAGQPSRR
jgi:methyltransferase